MEHEKSCGAVVFTRSRGDLRYVLIQQKKGLWGFPKGHVEAGETEKIFSTPEDKRTEDYITGRFG